MNSEQIITMFFGTFVLLSLVGLAIFCPLYRKRQQKRHPLTMEENDRPVVHDAHDI